MLSLLMYAVNHPLIIGKLLIAKLHGIPHIVAAPILPVLDDTIERDTRFLIGIDHIQQLLRTDVTLAALMETIRPEWQHRHLSRKPAHPADYTVSMTTVDEIVVHQFTYLRLQFQRPTVIVQRCRRIVVPKDAIALDTLEEMGIVLLIRLHHAPVLSALVHLTVLEHPKTIDRFLLIQFETLNHTVTTLIHSFRYRTES